MIGEQWNTLVAPPSDRELDAAMATVRVRAMDHWKRRVVHGRMLLGVGMLAVAAAGAYGGRVTGTGLKLTDELTPELLADSRMYRSSVEPAPTVGAQPPASARRFHVRARTVIDGALISAGDAWIEGPAGTGFSLSVQYEGQRYAGEVDVDVLGDSMRVAVYGSLSRWLGYSQHGANVTEETRGESYVLMVPTGQRIVLYPFGTARGPFDTKTSVEIDGPWAPAPEAAVRWRSADTTAPFFMAVRRNREIRLAAEKGVRHAMTNVGALVVTPRWRPAPMRVRIALDGSDPGEWMTISRWNGGQAVLGAGMRTVLALDVPPESAADGCVSVYVMVPPERVPGIRLKSSQVCFARDQAVAFGMVEQLGRVRIERELPRSN